MNNNLPLEEQETIINLDYISNLAYVYSSRISMVKHLRGLVDKHPQDVKIRKETAYDISVSVPIKWIKKINPPTTRTLSEEQKRAAKERMMAARIQKKSEKQNESLRTEK